MDFYLLKICSFPTDNNSFTLREKYTFSIFLASVTLTLTRWPSYMNLTSIPWRYTGWVKMNFSH